MLGNNFHDFVVKMVSLHLCYYFGKLFLMAFKFVPHLLLEITSIATLFVRYGLLPQSHHFLTFLHPKEQGFRVLYLVALFYLTYISKHTFPRHVFLIHVKGMDNPKYRKISKM